LDRVSSDNGELAVIAHAFGCGEALARTIAALGRGSEFSRAQLLYPLPGREETSLLTAGQAHEVAYGRDGAVLVLHLVDPGEFYGSLVGLGDGAGPAQVEALRDGRALHYGGEAVLRLMESYACVAVAVTRQLGTRLAAMRQRMVETSLLSATGRICAELRRLAEGADDGVIRPMPVLAELAQRVQSTRETVSRTVSQLERRGILRRGDGGLALIAPHRLDELIY
jgi:CRP/FNR family cyclic AMP-dependent transcriptional regulator